MAVKIINSIGELQKKYGLSNKIPLFAQQEYADYLISFKGVKTIWFVEMEGDSLMFILPFAIHKKFSFTKGYFHTAVNNLENSSVEREQLFLNAVISIIKKTKLCDWIQQPPNWAIFNSYPDGAVFAPFGSYKINLQEKTKDELFDSIQTKDRSDIRKAVKEGVEVKNGFHLLNDALVLIKQTAEKANISVPTVNELNYLKNNLNVFVSYYQNIPQSSAVFYSNNYAWYNMYAGAKDKPFRGSNSLLYWSAIKFAKESKVLFFDFVGARINPEPGSKQEKIQRFKEHFGVELHKGYLWKMPISKVKYSLYSFLIKIISIIKRKKLKSDIIDQEIERQINV